MRERKNLYRTTEVNSVIFCMQQFYRDLTGYEKRKTATMGDFSNLVDLSMELSNSVYEDLGRIQGTNF